MTIAPFEDEEKRRLLFPMSQCHIDAMNQCFQIQVNGESREAKAGMTVADLLRELEIKSDRVAVEVNLEILDKGVFAQRSLQAGDRVEIISFIGGGSEEVISNQLSAKDKDSSGVFPKAES